MNLKLALKYGGDPNFFDKSVGIPIIFYASHPYSIEKFNLLIAAGADIEKKSISASTALLESALFNQYKKAYILLQLGADYKIQPEHGMTIKWIIENNNVDEKSDEYKWRKKVIKFLQKKGVRFNIKTK